MGPELFHNTYHIEVVRSHLTRNLGTLYPEIRDEIRLAFDEVLDLRDNGEFYDFIFVSITEGGNSDWKSVPALSAIRKVVCRTSNRLFVGLPLCMQLFYLSVFVVELGMTGRDPDWINLNLRYTLDVVGGAKAIRSFPSFLAPYVSAHCPDEDSSQYFTVSSHIS